MTNDQEFTRTEEALKGAVSTTCVTEDGQSEIIIVAPPNAEKRPTTNNTPESEPVQESVTDHKSQLKKEEEKSRYEEAR